MILIKIYQDSIVDRNTSDSSSKLLVTTTASMAILVELINTKCDAAKQCENT